MTRSQAKMQLDEEDLINLVFQLTDSAFNASVIFGKSAIGF